MSNELHGQGTVFKYPYIWQHQTGRRLDNPKDRTVCLLFKLEREDGNSHLVIVAISDLKDASDRNCIKVPEAEKIQAGLNEFRDAYVHVGEYNVDRQELSLSYNPCAKPMGKFSRSIVMRVAKVLAENIRSGRAKQMDRE